MTVAGTYAVVTRTPLGEQRGTFTVEPQARDRFTGRVEHPTGAMDVIDGRIDGNRLTWTMDVTAPIRMKLDCDATVDGDAITGAIRAGVFGTMALSGARVG